ncbi:MarR family transcriptional regulator [Dyella nitratireducens]|uniref:Transcriptional regulator n=1 Tax=Dyella nitratireducens TaxID=1849580 RepID=A0ABQ1GM69_9GAMM|nr:MarR family transcriptional regulator [Dyella nitratireducens]GGA46573.1 hypothetical protein GCM10010981_39650 [Dyella nitratireducens]GLQ41467.1 hypothetical protein GCM10007902_13170 [Dyella nitratireducens]
MKTIKIGIMSQEKIRERVLAIATGKLKPSPDDPKIWFPSMKSLATILSDENRELLRTIAETHPASIAELATTMERSPKNLSRILKTMANYGLVKLEHQANTVKPVAEAARFHIVAI